MVARAVPRGFTLVELIVVVAVVVVLITLAAPSVRDLILSQRLKSVHAQIVTDLQFARAEAVAKGRMVTVSFRAAGSTGAMSCYILLTDNAASNFVQPDSCDCTRPEGSRCLSAGTREIRTVQIPRELGVLLSVPSGQANRFAYNPITGGIVLVETEAGVPSGDSFTITSSIDGNRRLNAVVGLAGRVSVCSPTGSAVPDTPCAP